MTAPDERPLPQAWVPRVVNAVLFVLVVALLSPAVTRFGGLSTPVQVVVVLVSAPLVLVAVLALVSAVRPGSLGRAARRARARRSR